MKKKHYDNAQEAINVWLGQDENTQTWKAIKSDCGIDKNGVSSSWNGFQASVFVDNSNKEVVITYRGTDSPLDILYPDIQIGTLILQTVKPDLPLNCMMKLKKHMQAIR